MSSAQQLLRSQRDSLLMWTCEHPAPLLRWLHDAQVLTSDQYLSLLQRSASNAVAQTLETVGSTEESSRRFLLVLREVQDYYCADLQAWVEKHCRSPAEAPVTVNDTQQPKGKFNKLFKNKMKLSFKDPDVKAQSGVLATIKVAISAHKRTTLKRTGMLKSFSEGEEVASNSASHIEIRYTDIFITEDNDFVDNNQHEYFDLASRRARIYVHQACRRIKMNRLLSPEGALGKIPKRVKVKGIAGIGKSIAVQRLVYEWAIGKSMHEFVCVFDLRFRELNLIKEPLSLLELLRERFRYLENVLTELFTSQSSLLFILDGLDEFKFTLDWDCPDQKIDLDTKVPVQELIVALIKGSLLPNVSVILTTRPSTEAPKRFFQRCCVVLGFEEDQVREYTRKFYKDLKVAVKVYEYVLNNDNLFVLSFIPLYCYIICTAMAEFFSSGTQDGCEQKSLELNPPRTVSEVYFCFLFTAVKHHALRGSTDRSTSRSEVLALAKQQLTNLGKLAYENLLQKKIMFERRDLENYGITPNNIHGTFLSHILVPLKEKTMDMFSFFHLTIQEHLAALYCAINLFGEEIIPALDLWCFGTHPPSSTAAFLQNTKLTADKLESLQMFTRFFMGTLRARLAGQLDGLVVSPVEQEEDIPARLGVWFQKQFKERQLENQETMHLLHCLMEFHTEGTTSTSAPEIKKLNLFKMKLSVVDCAAMHYVLKFSQHKLQELNVGYSNIGNKGLDRLGPILHRCESLYLRYNCLDWHAAILESAILRSKECQVKKLFMCGNNLGAEGVLEMWGALENNTTVEELYLDITGITERGTENMVQCLSKNTTLKTLTMVGNDIGATGRRRLRDLGRSRPGLKIIANFADDAQLLQAYLDWVEEIRVDRDQMASVRNADALRSVLRGLEGEEAGQNSEKAKELWAKIVELLKSSPDVPE